MGLLGYDEAAAAGPDNDAAMSVKAKDMPADLTTREKFIAMSP